MPARKYMDYMDEISSDELYEGLLSYGLFADKLPPVFTGENFLSVYFHSVAIVFCKG